MRGLTPFAPCRKEYPAVAPDPANGTDYTYTTAGRLASRTWARGVITNYAYNRAGDLLAVDYVDVDATPDVLYSYTRTGQQDEVKDGQFAAAPFTAGAILATAPTLDTTRYTYAYGYNGEQQLETETVSGLLAADAVLTRAYQDGAETNGLIGRSSGYSLSNDGGTSTDASAAYTFDSAGRLKTVSDGTDTFTYGYLANTRNQLETVIGPVHTVTYSYEPGRNTMTQVENKRTVGGTGVISNYAYTYNALGQRTDRAQSGSAITTSTDSFSYDALGQVTGSTNNVEITSDAWNPSYNFDMIGNRTGATVDFNGSKDYTANLLNQYASITDVPTSTAELPINDADGNLTSDGGSWSYIWNGENRLINADNGTVSIDFEYDYQGRLVKKDDGTDIVVYFYDGWNRIATFEVLPSSFSLLTSNLWGFDLSGSMQGAGGVGGLLKEGNRYPTFDANGNIMQKLSFTGSVDMNVAYDPFGNIISGNFVGEYGFSTKPMVDGIEWYYYGFRYYDPVTGRWPSRDPIGEEGGLNLYGFVLNNSVGWVDYLGLLKVTEKYDPETGADASWKRRYNSKYRTLAWVSPRYSFTCSRSFPVTALITGCYKIKCKLKLEQEILVNGNVNSRSLIEKHGLDSILNHERMHVDSLIAEFKRIAGELSAEIDTFKDKADADKAVKKYKRDYGKKLAKVAAAEARHGNPGSPAPGVGY